MLTNDFNGLSLSRLGFGTMRLPLRAGNTVDEAQVDAMVDYALANGINYFDTAAPYHGGLSEVIVGKSLRRYPRESWYLADKYPGHQIAASYDPAATFEDQLKKCGVDYFDFYLLHNVYENSVRTYMDERWGILPYFVEQKRQGRIKYLGFSFHGALDTLETFLDHAGDAVDFCQIQLNYLDWTLQKGREKYEMLTQRGIPVWVMEPVRGGKLAALPEPDAETLRALRPSEAPPAWAFRFLMDLPNVKVILSGMSDLDQMAENVATFGRMQPLAENERQALLSIAEGMKNSIPCTACRYCTDSCPMSLDIPALIAIYNELRYLPTLNASMRLEAYPAERHPSACIGCGACARMCPQSIDIPAAMRGLVEEAAKLPSWVEISRQREEAAKKLST